jgi:ankyrin repeat protein
MASSDAKSSTTVTVLGQPEAKWIQTRHTFPLPPGLRDRLSVDIVAICAGVLRKDDQMSIFQSIFQHSQVPSTATKEDLSSAVEGKDMLPWPQEALQTPKGKPREQAGQTTKKVLCNWLTDEGMIRNALPVARIISFGLDLARNTDKPIDFSSAASELRRNVAEWREHFKSRTVVFVGHGYGAVLMVKLFDESPQMMELLESTAAMGFFAAPIPNFDDLIRWAKVVLGGASERMFESESQTSSVTAQMWSEFRNRITQQSMNISFFARETATVPEAKAVGETKAAGDKEGTSDKEGTGTKKGTGGKDGTGTKKGAGDKEGTSDKEGTGTKKGAGGTTGTGDTTKGTEREKEKEAWMPPFDWKWTTKSLGISDIAKFSGPQDPTFQGISDCISTAVKTHQLLAAAKRHDKDMITDLINQHVDLNLSNSKGETALHVAVDQDYQQLSEGDSEKVSKDIADIVERLLGTRKIDLSRQAKSGSTALHVAVLRGGPNCHKIVKLLLEAGAKPKQKNKEGSTPEELSCSEDIAKLLRNPPPVVGPPATTKLEKGIPSDDQRCACRGIEMTVRDIFPAEGKEPDRYIHAYPTVEQLIYGDQAVDKLLWKPQETPMCRWYHIPMNNVRPCCQQTSCPVHVAC